MSSAEDDQPTGDEGVAGWLPPQAPEAQPAPRFDPARPDDLPPQPPTPAPQADWSQQQPYPQQPYPQQPYPTPLPPVALPPRNDRAVLSLILGVGGLIAFFTGRLGLLFIINLPASIGAWVTGVQAKRRVDRGETDQHRGVAQAGLILGIVGSVIGVLALVAWIVLLTTSDDARHDLWRSLRSR